MKSQMPCNKKSFCPFQNTIVNTNICKYYTNRNLENKCVHSFTLTRALKIHFAAGCRCCRIGKEKEHPVRVRTIPQPSSSRSHGAHSGWATAMP